MKKMMTHVLKMILPKAIVYIIKTKDLLLSAHNNDMFPPEAMCKTFQDIIPLLLFNFDLIVVKIMDK